MKTFQQLVEANNFDYEYIRNGYKPEEVTGKKVKIELWYPNKIITNQKFLDHCKEVGGRPATFNEALDFALENPDLQKQHPLVTYNLEQLYYLYLNSDDGKRRLILYEDDPDGYWRDDVRFLVVPAPVPAAGVSDTGKLGSSSPLGSLPFDPSKLTFEYEGRKFKIVEE